jgi:serine/threonine-protein kinase
MMASSPFTDRQTFLANVRQSGLLTGDQLTKLAGQLPDSERGRVVARCLVERGLLTKFQAEHLLAGRTSGFSLGQYRILDLLGQGGMGRVFKAEHRAMNRLVALKVLAPNLLKTERAQELFRREARAVGQLVHPNIVTAFDANEVNGRFFLVLEYIEGPNLDQLVGAQGPLPISLACDYIRQVALGLQYAFERGVIHRDLKPANILLSFSREPSASADVALAGSLRLNQAIAKITDFGLARLAEPDTESEGSSTLLSKPNTVLGTPDYLAPEQARDIHQADIRSDLYSLGCTFYYLLTGQVPFPGGSTLEKVIRHTTEEPAPFDRFRKDTPAEVAAIVRRLLAKLPADRFQTPAELAVALAPIAVSEPTPWLVQRDPAPSVEFGSILPESEDSSALVSTLAPAGAPTPITLLTRLPPAAREARRQQLKIALLGSLAIVAGLLGLALGVALCLR